MKRQPKTPRIVEFERDAELTRAIENFRVQDGRPSITNAVHALCRKQLISEGLMGNGEAQADRAGA